MLFNDTMDNPQDVKRVAENYELQRVLARARRVMTPEQVSTMDAHLKKLMDRLSNEDGTPRPFTPTTS